MCMQNLVILGQRVIGYIRAVHFVMDEWRTIADALPKNVRLLGTQERTWILTSLTLLSGCQHYYHQSLMTWPDTYGARTSDDYVYSTKISTLKPWSVNDLFSMTTASKVETAYEEHFTNPTYECWLLIRLFSIPVEHFVPVNLRYGSAITIQPATRMHGLLQITDRHT